MLERLERLWMWVWVVVVVFGLCGVQYGDGCTTVVIGKDATVDGATYVLGTADTESGDFRVASVTRKVHTGGVRHLYPLNQEYPHLVSERRSAVWAPENLEDLPQRKDWKTTSPIGEIPEVNVTYGLIETGSGYGLINEYGLSFGESTCGGRFASKPIYAGGKAMIEVGQLMQIGLERAKTAREAIKVMGSIAEELGYYGAEFYDPKTRLAEAGETITIADGTEAWVFHILPTDTGMGALWAAQRVPDDSFAVVANRWIIRRIDKESDDFLYSSNLWEVARRNGLWREQDGKLDFLSVFGLGGQDRPLYATDRIWRFADLWAPSLKLQRLQYSKFPTTMKVDKKITVEDMLRLLRDHYEGTDLDLTQGIAAGPFGDPDRYDARPVNGLQEEELKGHMFPRAISMFRTLYFHIQRSHADLPKEVNARILVGHHEPSDTVVAPLYVFADMVPPELSTGSLFAYNKKSLYWSSVLLGNWVHKYYIIASAFVRPRIDAFESGLFQTMNDVEHVAAEKIANGSPKEAKALLSSFALESAERANIFLQELFYEVVAKFHDGLVFSDLEAPTSKVRSIFYPLFWLKAIGYFNSRTRNLVPDLSFASQSGQALPVQSASYPYWTRILFPALCCTSTLSTIVMGVILCRVLKRREGFIPIAD